MQKILRNLMQKTVCLLWPHLNHRIPSGFRFNKNLALLLQIMAWKYEPFTARKKEGKKQLERPFQKNFPKPHLYIRLSIFSQPDS